MEKIIKMFRTEFPYINREENEIRDILNNENTYFIEKKDKNDDLIAVSVINKNTILFICVDKKYRNKGIGSQLLKESEDSIKNNGFDNIVVGAGFNYIMPGVPTSKKYYESVNEKLVKEVDDNASNFFEKRGYVHSWDCNCFDMKMSLGDFNKIDNMINDTIKGVKYRWARLSDMDEIVECADDACQFQDTKFSKYYKNEKLYDISNNQRVIVAEKDNRIIGCIIMSIETEAKNLGSVGCVCVRYSETHQGVGTNLVILSTRFFHDIGLKNASLSYTYSGLDKMYGNAGYKISCYYMMATKDVK